MVHQRQGLPLGLEPGDHIPRVHSELDELEGDATANRLRLICQVDHPHPTLAEDFDDPERTDLTGVFLAYSRISSHTWRGGVGSTPDL